MLLSLLLSLSFLQPQDPNIIVFIGDDFNWTDLDAAYTPHLDSLADRGMTFRRFYSFTQCSPTRYASLFGRLGRRDGIGQLVNSYAPPEDSSNPPPTLDRVMLPEILPDKYRSIMFGKWHLGTIEGFQDLSLGLNVGAGVPIFHGFDAWFTGTMANLSHEGGTSYTDWLHAENGIYTDETRHAELLRLRKAEDVWDITSELYPQIPTFVWYAFNYPHLPRDVPPKELLPSDFNVPVTNREKFEAMITGLDTAIGTILSKVDLDNTYIFFFSDNGPPKGNAIDECPPILGPFQGTCTKTTVYEPGINVPMIVAGPGIEAGTDTEALVSCVDLMATIADIIGVESPAEDSISFMPVLRDPAARTRRYVYIDSFGMARNIFGEVIPKDERAAIGQRYKLRFVNGAHYYYDLDGAGEFAILDPMDPDLQIEFSRLRLVKDYPLVREYQEIQND